MIKMRRQIKGKNLKNKNILRMKDNSQVDRSLLKDEVEYNVDIYQHEDSEGFDYYSYVILDDLNGN